MFPLEKENQMLKKRVAPLIIMMLAFVATASAKITLKPGEMAPNFKLEGSDGAWHTLSSFRGQYVVLYFYPMDETPGCTTEACTFRDHLSSITKEGAKVIGVSVQTVKSHLAFIKKYHLNFLLLADPTHRVANEYGVYNPKWKVDNRVTFLLNPQGRIMKIYPKVDPKMNAGQIMAEMKMLKSKIKAHKG